jgi:uncharacterized protein YndB with AHSA1/START domain
MHATSTATVPAPATRVWEVLSDHEGMAHWGPGLSVSLRTEGADDRNGIGAVRVIDAPGPAPSIVEEVTAFEPGRRLGYKALSGVPLKNYRGEVVLREVAAGTEIAYTVSADQRVPLLEQLAVRAIARTLLAALVRRVRATTKD